MYLIVHARLFRICSLELQNRGHMYVFFSCLAISFIEHPSKLFIGHRKTCLKLQNNLKQMDVVLFCF